MILALLSRSARERRRLELTFPGGSVVELIAGQMRSGQNMLFGGRRVRTLTETLVDQPLNEWIFFNEPPPGSILEVHADAERLAIRIEARPGSAGPPGDGSADEARRNILR